VFVHLLKHFNPGRVRPQGKGHFEQRVLRRRQEPRGERDALCVQVQVGHAARDIVLLLHQKVDRLPKARVVLVREDLGHFELQERGKSGVSKWALTLSNLETFGSFQRACT
jgi:hypothetical protein